MKEINAKAIFKSARRIVEGEHYLRRTAAPAWLWFLRKESYILLKRSIRLWSKLVLWRVEEQETGDSWKGLKRSE